MNFIEANNALVELTTEIEKLSFELSGAQEVYLIKKAIYERDFAKYCLETEVNDSDATQTHVKATATNLAFDAKMEYIKAKSAYEAIRVSLAAKRDRLDGLRELCFNLRSERKIL